jgi:hypothetical protein
LRTATVWLVGRQSQGLNMSPPPRVDAPTLAGHCFHAVSLV